MTERHAGVAGQRRWKYTELRVVCSRGTVWPGASCQVKAVSLRPASQGTKQWPCSLLKGWKVPPYFHWNAHQPPAGVGWVVQPQPYIRQRDWYLQGYDLLPFFTAIMASAVRSCKFLTGPINGPVSF